MLNYRKFGAGEPLFILHGVFGSADNWTTVGKRLAETYEVFLVDQRNHGASFHDPVFTYEAMANDLLELMQYEGLAEINILGHSMGGKTAMKFAVNHPDRVKKLVVVDIAPKKYPPHHQNIFEAFEAVQLEEIQSRKEAEQQMNVVIKDFGVKQFLLKNLKRGPDGFRWKVNLPIIKKNIEEVGKGLEGHEQFSGETLFIAGGNSSYIEKEDHSIIGLHFKQAEIVLIEGAGHWVHAEKPLELFEEVDQFLSR